MALKFVRNDSCVQNMAKQEMVLKKKFKSKVKKTASRFNEIDAG